MAEAVSVREWFLPELFLGERFSQRANAGRIRHVPAGENEDQRPIQFGHLLSHVAGASAHVSHLNRSSRFLLQFFRLVVRGKRLDQRLQFAVHHSFQLMDGEPDAVIS